MEYLAALTIAIGSWLSVPGSWQPSDLQLDEARSQLMPYVSRQASLSGETLPNWSEYIFQFQGRVARQAGHLRQCILQRASANRCRGNGVRS